MLRKLIGIFIIRDSPIYEKKAAKESQLAREIFMTAFHTEKRRPFCTYTTRNRIFCQQYRKCEVSSAFMKILTDTTYP